MRNEKPGHEGMSIYIKTSLSTRQFTYDFYCQLCISVSPSLMHRGGGEVRGYETAPPPGKFSKNLAIKPKIGGPPLKIFPERFDPPPPPLGILAITSSTSLPWIFNSCASMLSVSPKPILMNCTNTPSPLSLSLSGYCKMLEKSN
jgi:hypothetical protein